MESIVQKKSLVRSSLLKRRDAISVNNRKTRSDILSQEIIEYIEREQVDIIHSYIPIRSEVDISKVLRYCIAKDIAVVCPRTLKGGAMDHIICENFDSMLTGLYGTLYPGSGKIYSGDYDMILIPGAAFDTNGYRLGYGGGYYDRFLAMNENAIHAGVLFKEQRMDNVPRETHDRKMNVCFVN